MALFLVVAMVAPVGGEGLAGAASTLAVRTPPIAAIPGGVSTPAPIARVDPALASSSAGSAVATGGVGVQHEATSVADAANTDLDSKTMTATPPGVPATVSVGEFLVRWAHLLDPDLPEGVGVVAVATALAEQGSLGDDVDLDRPLNEGDVVQFVAQIGVRLTTLHDDRPLPPASVDAFFDRFGEFLSGEQGAGLVFSRAACDPDTQTAAGEEGRAAGDPTGATAKPSPRP